MKRIIITTLCILLYSSCGDDYGDLDFKEEMRKFVIEICDYSRTISPNFIVIPQNGQELVTIDGEDDGAPQLEYLNSINGVGREDLFYGYNNDNEATPVVEINYMISFLDKCTDNGVAVLVTDYCWTSSKMDNSYQQNFQKGYISFAAPSRELDVIPNYPSVPFNVNSDHINNLNEAKNFLYLINPDNFNSRDNFIASVSATNYDVIIMDLFFDDEEFSSAQINTLKTKANGGKRLVISYISIGEAEDYRYYWKSTWKRNPPSWLGKENPDWEGNYKVRYWDSRWKSIIFGNDESYLKKILDAGFDGVYLDIIDAFEYFED